MKRPGGTSVRGRSVRDSGLSLVEVIIATSLIGLILLFLFGLLPSSGFMVRQAQQRTGATLYAEEIVAQMASMPFDSLKGAVGTLTPSAPGPLGGRLKDRTLADGAVLRPRVEMSALSPPDRLLQAVVVVEWTSGQRPLEFRLVRRFSSVLR